MPLTLSDTKKSGEGEITSQATQADTGRYGTYFWAIKYIPTNTHNLPTNTSTNTHKNKS